MRVAFWVFFSICFFLLAFSTVFLNSFKKNGCLGYSCVISRWMLKNITSTLDRDFSLIDPFPHVVTVVESQSENGKTVEVITLYAKVGSRVEGAKFVFWVNGLNGQKFKFDFGGPKLFFRVDDEYGYLDMNKIRSENGGLRASIKKGTYVKFVWGYLSERRDLVVNQGKILPFYLEKISPEFVSLVHVNDYE